MQSTPVHYNLDLTHLYKAEEIYGNINRAPQIIAIWKIDLVEPPHLYLLRTYRFSQVSSWTKLDRKKDNTGLIRVYCQIHQVLIFQTYQDLILWKNIIRTLNLTTLDGGSKERMPILLPDSCPLTWTKWRFVLIPNAFLICTFLQKENMLGNCMLCKTHTSQLKICLS